MSLLKSSVEENEILRRISGGDLPLFAAMTQEFLRRAETGDWSKRTPMFDRAPNQPAAVKSNGGLRGSRATP